MSNEELDAIIDWCRKKIVYAKSTRQMNSKTFDGYETAMKAVMSYLHSLKKAKANYVQTVSNREIIELANIIAERLCDNEDCTPCIRMGRRCNDYLKAERAIEAGYRKQSEGEWRPYKTPLDARQTGWICSNCSSVVYDLSNGDTDYCPYCGARMGGCAE